MIAPTLIALTMFASQYDCMDKLDADLINKPEHSTAKYIGKTTAMISLYGATAILRCEGQKYTVHILKGIRLSDFPL